MNVRVFKGQQFAVPTDETLCLWLRRESQKAWDESEASGIGSKPAWQHLAYILHIASERIAAESCSHCGSRIASCDTAEEASTCPKPVAA